MGVWKERGLEVGRSSRMDAKPCGHLNVYVSGRPDVHHPADPPCRRGSGARYSPISICTKSNEKDFLFILCFACGFARHNLSRSALQKCFLRRLLRLRLRKLVFTNLACLRLLVCVALWLAKFNLRFFSNQLSLNIH